MYIYMQAEFYIFPQTESSTIPERKIFKKIKLIRFHRTKVNLISLFFSQFDVAAYRSHPYLKSSSTGQWSDPNTFVRIFASSNLLSSAF